MVRVQLLGPPRVLLGGGATVGLRPTTRDRALAYLAHVGTAVERDRLGYLFWPDEPDARARHNVRQLLKRIRRLGWLARTGPLDVHGDSVSWPVETDVAALRAAPPGRWEAPDAVREFLAGFERNATIEYEAWLLDERQRVGDELHELALRAAGAAERAGATDRSAEILRPLLDGGRACEVLARFMDLAARAGRREEAISAYERVSARLRAELAMEPTAEANRLAARLRMSSETQGHGDGRTVGRARELAEVRDLLARRGCRMVTLLGPGGIGKSTLAGMVVDTVAWRYVDGAALISLEAIADAEQIPHTIAGGLGLSLDARLDPWPQLQTALRDLEQLLALDNAEHLAQGWPALAALLHACPRLTLLATSRERMRLGEECVYDLHGLGDEEGVTLVQERTRRVAPETAVGPAEALSISQAVGGSPLGIELAAAWLRVLSPAEVAAGIGRDPALLGSGDRDALPRHRSIDAAMGHSWALASSAECQAVEALSVLAAPYTSEMASAVAATDRPVLRRLVDKSLVQRRAEGRFASHPLVRQYAAARLAADDARRRAVRTRHAAAVLGSFDPPPPEPTPEQILLLEDAASAWRHAVEAGAWTLVRRATEGLVAIMDASGRCRMGLRLLSEASTALGRMDDPDPIADATLRVGEARLRFRLGQREESAAVAAAAVEQATAAGDERQCALALIALARARKWVDGNEGQYATALEALPVAESLGDPILMARARNELGCSAPTLEACRDHLQAGLGLVPADAAPGLRAWILANLGNVLWALGDLRGAIARGEQSRQVAEAAEDPARVAIVLADLAFTYADADDLDRAQRAIVEAEELSRDTEVLDTRAYVVLVAGEIRLAAGDLAGTRARMLDGLSLAAAIENEPFVLRALRLHGEWLMETGRTDEGLRILALVVPRAAHRGDFTSEITNPRVWEARTAGIDAERLDRARGWASQQRVRDLARAVLREAGPQPVTPGPA